jgi:tRNA(Ile)-lysidine synthase
VRGLTAERAAPALDLTARVTAQFDARLERGADAPLALALSGGGDSVALLALAADWAKAHGRRLLVLTVDHGLQSQSANWTRFAGALARSFGAAWRALAWTGSKPLTGLPAAAREARHALIAQAAREAGARVVLFAHTLDDIAEGEAMRAEGSTLGRLSAWSPSPAWPEGRGLFLLRPLLDITRAELRDFLRARGLAWIEDPANADLRYARARARVAPERPAAPRERPRSDLTSLAGLARIDAAGGIHAPREVFGAAGGAAFLSAVLVCAGGGRRPPRGERLMRLLARLKSRETFAATLAGARVDAGAERVVIVRDAGELARGGLQPMAVAAGEVAVWDGRFEIVAERTGEVRALTGLKRRLSPSDQALVARLPAAARPGVPVFVGDETLSPLSACSLVQAHCLVGARLAAACGVIAHEGEIAVLSRGELAAASLC